MAQRSLAGKRKAILAEIREAFQGVSREGGVSWSESNVIDDYGTDEERAVARARDLDKSWEEVANDPVWHDHYERRVGSFSFLDPIGYRYYLPAAMLVAIGEIFYEWLCYSLTLSRQPGLRKYKLEQWSLLDDRQRLCVCHFIEYMIEWSAREELYKDALADDWKKALDSYWKDVPDIIS